MALSAAAPSNLPTSGKVTVICKMPNGIILQLQRPISRRMPSRHGLVEVTEHERVGEKVALNGANSSRVIGGFGVTEVDAAFFSEWLKQNADLPHVTKGLIFAHQQPASAENEAGKRASLKHGLEPLDPAKPGPGIERVG